MAISAKVNRTEESVHYAFNPEFDIIKLPKPPQNPGRPKTTISTTTQPPETTFSVDISYRIAGEEHGQSHALFDPEHNAPGLWIEKMPHEKEAIFLTCQRFSITENMERFSKIAQQGREHELIDLLRIIEPHLEQIKLIQHESNMTFIHGKIENLHQSFPIGYMGGGLVALMNIILAISNLSSQGVLLVDEIENGFHHTKLENLWTVFGKAVRQYDNQLIATTHSEENLRAAYSGLSAMAEDFRYVRLSRKNGDIVAKTYNYQTFGDALKANFEIR